MKILENLNFSLTKKVPIIYQTEAAECGLACIAMIASYYGFVSDLSVLRRRFNLSQKGSTLNQLVNISNSLKLSSRPIRLELNRLSQLKLPCVIHWNFNHFVVLEQVKESKIEIVDPAFGRRSLSWGEFSQQFTGIALELWPMPEFEKKEESYQLKISDLLGSIQGIWKSASQIILLAIVLEVVTLLMPLLLQFVIDYVIVADDRGANSNMRCDSFKSLMIINKLSKFL
ncbi:cysteine peptidase family C39 domain-containing protein [Acinetobacter johnsonii]|uniref:cysteine peptidase family C39 domain-containing protein n=1 Tax=Acinetobacter johnsonii TaxID=40214 RepID=UPI003D176E62